MFACFGCGLGKLPCWARAVDLGILAHADLIFVALAASDSTDDARGC